MYVYSLVEYVPSLSLCVCVHVCVCVVNICMLCGVLSVVILVYSVCTVMFVRNRMI